MAAASTKVAWRHVSFPFLLSRSHYQCVHVDGAAWIRSDLTQACGGPEYSSNAVVAWLALLQVFVVPVVLFAILCFYQDRQDTEFYDINLAIWHNHYQSYAWFFEPFKQMRKGDYTAIFSGECLVLSSHTAFLAFSSIRLFSQLHLSA